MMIPISFAIAIAAMVIAYLLFQHMSRRDAQKTVQMALERGQELTPETLSLLITPQGAERGPNADLRRGILLLAAAGGIIALGSLVDHGGDSDVVAVGLFPAVLAVGYIFYWWINPDRRKV